MQLVLFNKHWQQRLPFPVTHTSDAVKAEVVKQLPAQTAGSARATTNTSAARGR